MVLPASDGVSRVPPYSGSTREGTTFQVQGCYLLRRAFPDRFPYAVPLSLHNECPTTPEGKPSGLGCFRFARRYSGNRNCFLFLWVLRCFSSPGLPSPTLCIQVGILFHYEQWVPPFGNPRIHAYLQLPEAYRCSFRPSSAPSAKAFTVRPSYLNHLTKDKRRTSSSTSFVDVLTYPLKYAPASPHSFPRISCFSFVSYKKVLHI
jgi:hypothetical protein